MTTLKLTKRRFRSFSLRELILHYTAIFDTAIGIALLTLPIIANGQPPEGWQVSLIVGLSPLWGIAFIVTGIIAFLSNVYSNTRVGRIALGLSAGLSAGRGVAFFFAAFAVWPSLAAILMSAGLLWIKQALFIFSVAKREDRRLPPKEE